MVLPHLDYQENSNYIYKLFMELYFIQTAQAHDTQRNVSHEANKLRDLDKAFLRQKETVLPLKPPLFLMAGPKRSLAGACEGGHSLLAKRAPRLLNSSSSSLVPLHTFVCCLVYLGCQPKAGPCALCPPPQGLSLTQHSVMFSLLILERPQHA